MCATALLCLCPSQQRAVLLLLHKALSAACLCVHDKMLAVVSIILGLSACSGVELIELLLSKEYTGQNRGFAFVEFYNHACAQHAKNVLSAPTYT